jgi:hypothetical protein
LPQTNVAGLLVAEVLAKDFGCRAWAAHLLLVSLAFGLRRRIVLAQIGESSVEWLFLA